LKSYQELFAELKRRRVFKVAGIYGIVAFGVLQAADLMLPRLGLPDWTVTFMVALVVLAFPVALLLAWAFDLTPEGMKRTDTAAPGEIEGIMAAPASQRWPAGLLALVGVLLLVGSTWWIARRTAPAPSSRTAAADVRLALAEAAEDDRPSLAVLPFVNMSADQDQEYFSDGITEEILNTLARVRELKVAARTSAFAFKGRTVDMRAVGDSLGVQYLIEGSVRKADDQLRITAQLIDAADGTHLWSEQYDREMNDVFAIQTEIAEAIARQLRVPLGLEDAAALVTPTADLEAYDLYLAGRANIRHRGAALREARALFEAVIARDSTWAPAWAGLAEASELSTWYPQAWDVRLQNGLEEAREYAGSLMDESVRAAERAIELDPGIASAYVALGSVARNRRQWERSEQAFLSAITLDPDNAEAHQQYSEMLGNMGRIAEARVASARALGVDRAPVRLLNRAGVLWEDGEPEAALDLLSEAFALDSEGTLYQLGWLWQEINIELGRYDDIFVHAFADWPEARRDSLLEAFRSQDPNFLPAEYADRTLLGGVSLYLAMGRKDLALEAIDGFYRSWPTGNFGMLWVPEFDSIRSEPRFQAILRDMNLAGRTVQRTPR